MTGQQFDASQPEFTAELLAILRQESFRDPTLDAVRAGRMSRAGLKVWVLQAMCVVRQFTRFISAIHANCPHRDAQSLLAENLWEEHGRGHGDKDHLALVERLARSLGATEAEMASAEPIPETADYINYCFRVTREGSFVEAMAAVGMGIEHYMPAFFGALAAALQSRYGLSREQVEYLLVHVEEDADHARRSMEMIERYADTDDVRDKTRQALSEMLRVKRQFGDALYARCLEAKDEG
jgi:pyrroloquinoline quinone (PQQ) biosynthesis protein C